MLKWEYKFIECIYHLEDWYPAFDNGQEISHWKTQGNIAAFSNALGEQGWEMVGCAASAAGTHVDYREFFRVVFKRPKA